jgi:hypothetical protein
VGPVAGAAIAGNEKLAAASNAANGESARSRVTDFPLRIELPHFQLS